MTQAKAKEVAEFVRENLFGGLESPTLSGHWVTQSFESVIENALLSLDGIYYWDRSAQEWRRR